MEKSVVLKGDEIQTVISALDFYSRIHIGQYKEILEIFCWNSKLPIDFNIENTIVEHLKIMRQIVYPELGTYLDGSYGIFNPKVQNTAGLAYNMQQVIRYKYSYAVHPEGGYTVNFSSPIATGPDPLPLCSIGKYKLNTLVIYLILSDKYRLVLKNALEMKKDLLELNIENIFKQCTDNPKVLLHANWIKEWATKIELNKDPEEIYNLESIIDSLA